MSAPLGADASSPPSSGSGSAPLVDLGVGALFAALVLVLYRATWQQYLWDDGSRMAAHVARDLGPWYHVALVPLATQVRRALGVVDGVVPLLVVSTAAAAIATCSWPAATDACSGIRTGARSPRRTIPSAD